MSKFFFHLWQNFKEYLVLIVLILIGLFLISQNNSVQIHRLRAMIFGTFSVVNYYLYNFVNHENLKEENEKLRLVNAELMLQLSKLRKDALLIDELKNALHLKDTSNLSLISSQILSRFVDSNQESVTINVGRKDGVNIGMPVISEKGLVGIIFSVSDDFALVKTLRNTDLSLTVKSERTGEQGILKWRSNKLRIINTPKTYQIKKGDRIITSELSTIIPVVLPVGVAQSTENVEKGIFNEIIVAPFVDFNRLQYVFVIPVVASKEIKSLELNLLKKTR
jgi:rod shape-determining protein MreC